MDINGAGSSRDLHAMRVIWGQQPYLKYWFPPEGALTQLKFAGLPSTICASLNSVGYYTSIDALTRPISVLDITAHITLGTHCPYYAGRKIVALGQTAFSSSHRGGLEATARLAVRMHNAG